MQSWSGYTRERLKYVRVTVKANDLAVHKAKADQAMEGQPLPGRSEVI
jgi:hypothetical protein